MSSPGRRSVRSTPSKQGESTPSRSVRSDQAGIASSPSMRSNRSTPSKRSDTSELQPLPPSSPGSELLPPTSPAPHRLYPGNLPAMIRVVF